VSLYLQPLQQINNAHLRECSNSSSNSSSSKVQGGSAGGRATRAAPGSSVGSSRGKKASQGPPSVTSVVFIDEYVLASAGASDGAVKLWDLRKAWNHQVCVSGADLSCILPVVLFPCPFLF